MVRLFNHNSTLSVLTGIALTLAFPFSGSLTPLIFIAWTPIYLVALKLKEQPRAWLSFFGLTYLNFLIFNIGTTWWIWNSTAGGAIMAFVCNSLLMAIAMTIGFTLFKKQKPTLFLIGLGSTWLCFEFLHLNWELSWPWLTMGNFFSNRSTWIQWYEYTGTLGGSSWVILVNIFITLGIFQQRNYKFYMYPLLLLIIPILLSLLLTNTIKQKENKTLNVVLLQPNIDPYTEKFNTDPSIQLRRMLNMATPYIKKNTLVIGPETAIQEAFVERDFKTTKCHSILDSMLSSEQANLLIGASTFNIFQYPNSAASKPLPDGRFYESYNTAIYFNKENPQFIHKSKLVLGVEKIPFSSWIPWLEKFSIENGGTSGSLGVEASPKVFKNGSQALAPIICYESIYGDFVAEQCNKGAELLCIITNDGWWGNTPGHKQHNQFAALRAIETRKYVVRSGNTGISSVWDPSGNNIEQSKYNEKIVISSQVEFRNGKTIYVKYGDYLGWINLVILGSLSIHSLLFGYFKKN